MLFERLVRRRNLSLVLSRRLALTPSTERLTRLIAAFLRGQFSLPGPVDKVLTTPLLEHRHQPEIEAQVALFEPQSDRDDGRFDLSAGESGTR